MQPSSSFTDIWACAILDILCSPILRIPEMLAKSVPGEWGHWTWLTTCMLCGNTGWNSTQGFMEALAWAWAGGKVSGIFVNTVGTIPYSSVLVHLCQVWDPCWRKEQERRKGRVFLVLNILPLHSRFWVVVPFILIARIRKVQESWI